jgi:hypothetical protein
MARLDLLSTPQLVFEERLSDGSDTSTPATDNRSLFLGEDGLLHLKDSAGTVTTPGGGMTNPMTTLDDVIIGGASGAPARLAKGANGTFLGINGSGHVAYGTPAGGGSGTVERALVDPTGLSWSWVNQGIASVATSGATIYLSSAASTADDWHIRIKALANSKPYTEIFHINPMVLPGDFGAVMVGWLDSATNKFVSCIQLSQSGQFHLTSSKSGTNYVVTANYKDLTGSGEMWKWIALCDDATNRQIYVSRDGNNWLLFHSVATNDFLTPDRIMFGLEARNATNPIGLLVDSLDAHTGSTP